MNAELTKRIPGAVSYTPLNPLPRDIWLEWYPTYGKAQWDIMSALRGPDNSTDFMNRVKLYSTAVIRGTMRLAIRTGGMVNTTADHITLPIIPAAELKTRCGGKGFYYDHFRQHVIDAAHHLQTPVSMLTLEEFDKLIP